MPKIVDHDERRERIVEIVAEMLATVGAEKTTIREIARQSGYSRGFIEHYFHDKEELISKTIRWINERSLQRVNEALDGKTGLAALRTFNELTLPITPKRAMNGKSACSSGVWQLYRMSIVASSPNVSMYRKK
jgi:AcrR family transcriptional regulator